MAGLPDLGSFDSLVDLFDTAPARLGKRPLLVAERHNGDDSWSADDLVRRSRMAAYRLLKAGVAPGDRILTVAPNGPELAAIYLAAWRARIIPVPLDLRFTPDVVTRIAERADTKILLHGGMALSATDIAEGGPLDGLTMLAVEDFVADTDAGLPHGWSDVVDALPRPGPDDLYAIMFTSGTTGQPRGVMLAHRNFLEPWALMMSSTTMKLLIRLLMPKGAGCLSIMPFSHIFGLSELIAAPIFGMRLTFPDGRSPRAVLEAMRKYRPTSMSVAPRFLELFWTQLRREIATSGSLEAFDQRRERASRYPYWLRRRLFRRELALLGGRVRWLSSGAAFLAPDVQAAWESIGIPVLQGYGATECGAVAATSYMRRPHGKVGRRTGSARVELAPDGEILVSGPSVTAGYWRDPEATRAAWDEQGRYHTGDVGHFDTKGDLVLLGRKKNVIVLGNGLNVYPEDIERELFAAGLGETVVLETAPGRIEAVILDPERPLSAADVAADATVEERRGILAARIGAAVQAANAKLTAHERVDAWRLWPDADFPRTHTLKIRRDPVRQWAATPDAVPLPVHEGMAEA